MSDKKVDKRILHSKKFIKDALIELMKTKNAGRISVLELCRKADVNRNTFYAHYSTPEDVLAEIENELRKEYEEIMIANHGDTIAGLNFLKTHADILHVLLDNPGSDFRDYLFTLSREMYLKKCLEFGISDSRAAECIYVYTSAGANQIASAWIRENCQMPVEEVAGFMEMMLSACISAAAISEAKNLGSEENVSAGKRILSM